MGTSVNPNYRVRSATALDLGAINAIYNREIEDGLATWDEQAWTEAERRRWWDARPEGEPVLVAADPGGEVVGFACLSWYRSKSGYRFTREDTLYISPRHQRRGVGALLLAALIDQSRLLGLHSLIAVIEAGNVASVSLHERLGFQLVGREVEVGYKLDRWLDTQLMQLLLPSGAS